MTSTQKDVIFWWVGVSPKQSTCELARELNASGNTGHKLLRVEGLYPFYYTTLQVIHPDDFLRCIDFCNCKNTKPIMLSLHISFGWMKYDFTWWSLQHVQQSYLYAVQSLCNPLAEISNPLVCVLGRHIRQTHVRQYLLCEQLTGHSYLVLPDVLIDFLNEIHFAAIHGLWFLHYEASAYFSSSVRDWLVMEYTGRWIGRVASALQPLRSPDLTPLDFILWGI